MQKSMGLHHRCTNRIKHLAVPKWQYSDPRTARAKRQFSSNKKQDFSPVQRKMNRSKSQHNSLQNMGIQISYQIKLLPYQLQYSNICYFVSFSYLNSLQNRSRTPNNPLQARYYMQPSRQGILVCPNTLLFFPSPDSPSL